MLCNLCSSSCWCVNMVLMGWLVCWIGSVFVNCVRIMWMVLLFVMKSVCVMLVCSVCLVLVDWLMLVLWRL